MESDKGGEEIHTCPFKSFLQMFFSTSWSILTSNLISRMRRFGIHLNKSNPLLQQQSPTQLTRNMKNGQKGSSRRPFKKFNWRLSYPSEIGFRAHWGDQYLGLSVGIQIGSLCVALKMPAVLTIHGVLGCGLGLRVLQASWGYPSPPPSHHGPLHGSQHAVPQSSVLGLVNPHVKKANVWS